MNLPRKDCDQRVNSVNRLFQYPSEHLKTICREGAVEEKVHEVDLREGDCVDNVDNN